MWKLARDDHNNDASDDGDGSAPASRRTKDDDYDDAHGRRVLIARAVRDCICRRPGRGGLSPQFQKAALNSTSRL